MIKNKKISVAMLIILVGLVFISFLPVWELCGFIGCSRVNFYDWFSCKGVYPVFNFKDFRVLMYGGICD